MYVKYIGYNELFLKITNYILVTWKFIFSYPFWMIQILQLQKLYNLQLTLQFYFNLQLTLQFTDTEC